FLVAGISWLAHSTLATPRKSGYPTVLAQEAQKVFGNGAGHIMFFVVQAATALILFTGANTSFNGFPFLASYVAGDAFLPRGLLKRGPRLVFSNAIIGLTIVSIVLLIVRGSNVNNLVPLYAIGVFTAFTMAGFGMARYHKRRQEPGWRHKRVINLAAGALSAGGVPILPVGEVTQSARLVGGRFPLLWFSFLRVDHDDTSSGGVRGAEEAAGAAELPTAHGVPAGGQLRPGHARGHALRAEPEADHAARGALRHRHRRGGRAAPGVVPRRPGHRARLHRLPGPAAGPGRGRTCQRRGPGARHARHRSTAPAQPLTLARAAAARPHRRQDRGRGEPHAALRAHERAFRRPQP